MKCNRSETCGLALILEIKARTRIMLIVNIDFQDRPMNGQLGTIKHISLDTHDNATKIYIKFIDCEAGLK